MNLLLALERRFVERRKAGNERARAEQIGRVRIALMDCAHAVERLQSFWDQYSQLGQLEITSEVFRPGSAQKYLTQEEYFRYAELLDYALRSISMLNHALGVILFSDADLPAEADARLADVLKRLRKECGDVLGGQITMKQAMETVSRILRDAQEFLRTAHHYFGRDIEPPDPR